MRLLMRLIQLSLYFSSSIMFTIIASSDTGVSFSVPLEVKPNHNLTVEYAEEQEHNNFWNGTIDLTTVAWRKKKVKKGEAKIPVVSRIITVGTVHIGNQPFNVIFDTGSTSLWVSGKEVLMPGNDYSSKSRRKQLKRHHFFDIDKSSTFTQGDAPFKVMYGGGTSVSGTMGHDTLKVGDNLIMKDVAFGVADTLSRPQQSSVTYDGVFGLAYASNASNKAARVSPFAAMVRSGVLRKNIFSLYMSNDGETGNIMFGGWDEKYMKTPIQFMSVMMGGSNQRSKRWVVKLDEIGFDGREASTVVASYSSSDDDGDQAEKIRRTYSALVDSGSTHIRLPKHLAEIIIGDESLWGALDPNKVRGYSWVPCKSRRSLPKLILQMGGANFELSGTEYTTTDGMVVRQNGESKCPLLLRVDADNPKWSKEGFHTMVLGGPFLRKYYTVFIDHEGEVNSDGTAKLPEMGFARAAHKKKW